MNTPLIPEEVYELIPEFLKKCVSATQKTGRERDVFFTSLLTVMSGSVPAIKGTYQDDEFYPHLFSLVVAPPANGKRVLGYAKKISIPLHQKIQAASIIENSIVDQVAAAADYRRKSKNINPPKVLFIPANVSSARFQQHLEVNDGGGIMFETEIDTLVTSLKQDWGNFDDMLRKAFQHEAITSSRKGENSYIEINEPKLAAVLSGTPGQFLKLISSSENGLFSRFLIYAFQQEYSWKSGVPTRQDSLSDCLGNLGSELLVIAEYLTKYPSRFVLKADQWRQMDEAFTGHLQQSLCLFGETIAAVVYRYGLIAFRIAMVLSAFRKFEEKNEEEDLVCTDQDFKSAMLLIETYLKHSSVMLQTISQSARTQVNKIDGFFQKLPARFERKEAVEIGNSINISDSSVGRHLSALLKFNYLKQPTYGIYEKVA